MRPWTIAAVSSLATLMAAATAATAAAVAQSRGTPVIKPPAGQAPPGQPPTTHRYVIRYHAIGRSAQAGVDSMAAAGWTVKAVTATTAQLRTAGPLEPALAIVFEK